MLRENALERLRDTHFDLLVVGGGITGAGVARCAALRGLRVALVERHDFASGTSSRSSRLVHGGVRYLEHGQLRLVFEASRERRLLLELAPHLVRPLHFTWPIYRGGRLPRWKVRAGLWLYDILARFGNVGRHDSLTTREVLEREPALRTDALVGGAGYWDASTHDARLTLATVLGAIHAGATAVNYCEVRELIHADGRVAGATVTDGITGMEHAVRARVVVNATGPWTDRILAMDDGRQHAEVRGTKGVHVLVPRERVRNEHAVTLLSPVDGRVMFVLPAGDFTLVGTTDTRTEEHPDEVRASAADVDYLLRSVNDRFPRAALTREDVVSAWAGIRPLVASGQQAGGADSEGRASREHAITRGDSGLLTITGGKLTTYRSMAAEVVEAVGRELGRPLGPERTATLPLPGGTVQDIDAEVAAAAATVGDAAVAAHLVAAYGDHWRQPWGLTQDDPTLASRLDPTRPYLCAEVAHAAQAELALTPGDVLIRRMALAFETRDHGRAVAPRVAAIMAPIVGRDPRDLLAGYDQEAARIFDVREG